MGEIKLDCGLIQDLLPLYQDGICSAGSKKAVEEHLKDCSACRNMADQLQDYNVDEILIQEKNNILKKHDKKERRKTFSVGIVTASVLMIPVIVCLICNLAIGHALDWFFIVLAAMLLVASLTVVPMLAQEKRGVWTILGFTGSLLLLLLVCCIYTHGNWFLVAAAACVFGLSVFLAPYIICRISLPAFFRNKKGLLAMIWDTLWLYVLVIVCGIFVKGGSFYWHVGLSTAFYGMLLPWMIFVIARYFRGHLCTKTGWIVILTGVYAAFSNDIITLLSGVPNGGSIFQADLMAGFASDNLEIFNGTVFLTILIVSLILGGLLILVGIFSSRKGTKDENN